MVKMKETTDRAKKWKCVRFDDKNGFTTKFNKTNFPNESRREMYYYSVKCIEHGMRGFSLTSVATKKKFQKFRKFSEGLKLDPLPEGFQFFSHMEKRGTVEKLVDVLVDKLAAAMSHGPVQGADTQADYPAAMQVGEGSGPDPAWEGSANTSFPPADSLQNAPLGGVPSVRLPGVPRGFTHDLGSFTLSQLDNPVGRPPPSFRQYPDELNQSMSDMEWRAFRYLDREMNDEDPQNQLRKTSMEDAGSQDGEDLRNRSISEALEVVPRFTGRDRKNVGDICPEVNGGSADGDLPSKPIMEGFSPQASDFQVSDLCSGGENYRTMPNPGGNNSLQIVGIDCFVSAEPSADEREQWAEWQLGQFDMSFVEDFDMQVINPGQIQVDEAAPNLDFGNILSNDASLQTAWIQCDNRGGQSRSLLLAQLQLLVSNFTNLMQSASVLPDMWPQIEETLRSFVSQWREAFGDRSEPRQEGLSPKEEYFSAPQNGTSPALMDESLENEICPNLPLLRT